MARFLASDSDRLSRCSFRRDTSSLWYACASALLCSSTADTPSAQRQEEDE